MSFIGEQVRPAKELSATEQSPGFFVQFDKFYLLGRVSAAGMNSSVSLIGTKDEVVV